MPNGSKFGRVASQQLMYEISIFFLKSEYFRRIFYNFFINLNQRNNIFAYEQNDFRLKLLRKMLLQNCLWLLKMQIKVCKIIKIYSVFYSNTRFFLSNYNSPQRRLSGRKRNQETFIVYLFCELNSYIWPS